MRKARPILSDAVDETKIRVKLVARVLSRFGSADVAGTDVIQVR
jgi:hypothetical protein